MSKQPPAVGFVIFNAYSGKDDHLTPSALLEKLPEGTRLHEFAKGDDPVQLATDAIAGGSPWVAVAGGDGTVEAVAGALAGTDVPLGVITNGTFNNFSRSAGVPADPLEAAGLIAQGSTRQVDVGYVNGRTFFECVGVGLDAAIFPEGEKIKSGGIMSWIALLKKVYHYERQVFEIELDRPFREALVRQGTRAKPSKRWRNWLRTSRHHRIRLKALMITVSNGPYYGMNFAVAPDARIDDGSLTISIFKKYSKLELWWHFWSIRSGRRVYAPRVVTLNATKIRIDGPKKTDVHLDGTPFDEWPLEISLRSNALRIFGGAKSEAESNAQ